MVTQPLVGARGRKPTNNLQLWTVNLINPQLVKLPIVGKPLILAPFSYARVSLSFRPTLPTPQLPSPLYTPGAAFIFHPNFCSVVGFVPSWKTTALSQKVVVLLLQK